MHYILQYFLRLFSFYAVLLSFMWQIQLKSQICLFVGINTTSLHHLTLRKCHWNYENLCATKAVCEKSLSVSVVLTSCQIGKVTTVTQPHCVFSAVFSTLIWDLELLRRTDKLLPVCLVYRTSENSITRAWEQSPIYSFIQPTVRKCI